MGSLYLARVIYTPITCMPIKKGSVNMSLHVMFHETRDSISCHMWQTAGRRHHVPSKHALDLFSQLQFYAVTKDGYIPLGELLSLSLPSCVLAGMLSNMAGTLVF